MPAFAGIAVTDLYVNYFHAGWEHLAGHQACAAHLIRDFQDAAETYPGEIWPVQAQRALRGLIKAWHDARADGLAEISAATAGPLENEFRHAVLAGLSPVRCRVRLISSSVVPCELGHEALTRTVWARVVQFISSFSVMRGTGTVR